jgi:hypothetical protein
MRLYRRRQQHQDYWSSTTSQANWHDAFLVDFYSGFVFEHNEARIRVVREAANGRMGARAVATLRSLSGWGRFVVSRSADAQRGCVPGVYRIGFQSSPFDALSRAKNASFLA